MADKKYQLKPGNHQFAPGEHAVHNNETITDETAEFYLNHYPHIKAAFEKIPVAEAPVKSKPEKAKADTETTESK